MKLSIQVLIIILISTAANAIPSYISSQDQSSITTTGMLTSPLGYFQLKLLSNCSLELLAFNSDLSQYQRKQLVTGILGSQVVCTSLSANHSLKAIVTQNGTIFRRPSITNINYTNLLMGINDFGGVYLTWYWLSEGKVRGNTDYLQSSALVQLHLLSTLQSSVTYTNKNNFNFTNNNGLISISKSTPNSTYSKIVDLRGYQLSESGFTDPQGQTRYAVIPGMTLVPRTAGFSCSSPQGVFMQFSEYWGNVRVFDRDRYLVAEYSIDDKFHKCPQQTFELKGQCLTNCPAPYLKSMTRNFGTCVLNCQKGSIQNQTSNTCTSSLSKIQNINLNTILKRNCPLGSTAYEYGCVCENGYYEFDKNVCGACNEGHFGVRGVCMKCSQNCKKCQVDPNQINFLVCLQCFEGWSGTTCSNSISTCSIQNCAVCQNQTCIQCRPFFALSNSKLSCLLNCSVNDTMVMGSIGEGYCIDLRNVNSGGNANDFVGGHYSGITYLIRKNGMCASGMRIMREKCLVSCPQGMDVNVNFRCICPSGMATFQNQTCYRISDLSQNLIGYYYNSTFNTFLNCPASCLFCDSYGCLKCIPDHILVVTPLSSLCRQRTLHFSCLSSYYQFDEKNGTCIAKNMIRNSSTLPNCAKDVGLRCVACREGYVFANGICTSVCPLGSFNSNGVCIKIENNCEVPQIVSHPLSSEINQTFLSGNVYRLYSSNNVQISNEPISQIMAIRNDLGIQSNTKIPIKIYYPKQVCKMKISKTDSIISNRCTNSPKVYQLLNGTCVETCPENTQEFIDKNKSSAWCLPKTRKQCLQSSQGPFLSSTNGQCVNQCSDDRVPTQFGNGSLIQCVARTACQKINIITPFKLNNNQCSSACPTGTSPIQKEDQIVCQQQTSEVRKPLNLDASVYTVSETERIFYFVVDSMLQFENIKVNYYTKQNQPMPSVSSTQIKVGQSQGDLTNSNIDFSQFNNKTYLAVTSTADEVILDLSDSIRQIKSIDGNILASSLYGVKYSQDHIGNSRSWLAIIAYVLSLLLICLHSIYIGNTLLYKIDNWLIFAQSLYFFSFVHLLINASIGQFYYGFLWSHFGFFPNYFAGTIPSNYMQGYNNDKLSSSYRLLTGDSNFIRNAGFSFSLLCTFLAGFFIMVLLIWVLKRFCGKYELWYKRIAHQALVAAFEFVSMNIFYWAVSHLLNNQDNLFSSIPEQPLSHSAFRTSCSAASIAFICIYGIYMILRFIKNKIGGLYMFKRLAFATILAASAFKERQGQQKLFVIPLVATEIIFMLGRFIIQKPYLKRQKIFIILQTVLKLIAYITIFLWNDTGFVSIFVSIIIFVFIFLFVEDLLDVYLDNSDQFYDDKVQLAPGLRHKQFLNSDDYEKITNPATVPETDRKLKS